MFGMMINLPATYVLPVFFFHHRDYWAKTLAEECIFALVISSIPKHRTQFMWTLSLKTPPTLNIWTPSLKHWRGLSCHKSSEEGGTWTARKQRSLYTTLCSCVFLYLRTCVFAARKIPPLWHGDVSSRLPSSVVNDEAKLWNPIYSPLSHSTSETSSLLLWTRILLRLKRFLLTHFQQSSRVDFQLKKYQPFGKIQSVQNVLFWKFVKVFCLFGKI